MMQVNAHVGFYILLFLLLTNLTWICMAQEVGKKKIRYIKKYVKTRQKATNHKRLTLHYNKDNVKNELSDEGGKINYLQIINK